LANDVSTNLTKEIFIVYRVFTPGRTNLKKIDPKCFPHFHDKLSLQMSYQLCPNWKSLVEDVRAGRLTSPTPSVVWNNNTKHGLQEGSASRDILSYISRQADSRTTRDALLSGIPNTFESENKIPRDLAQEYLRELVKMGILLKLEE